MSGEQDFTDPEFVLGAILAQLEDLDPMTALAVVAQASLAVAARLDTEYFKQ